jgi:hypothetical protein
MEEEGAMAFRRGRIFAASLAAALTLGSALSVLAQPAPEVTRESVQDPGVRLRIARQVARYFTDVDTARRAGNCREHKTALARLELYLLEISQAHEAGPGLEPALRDDQGFPRAAMAEYHRRFAEDRALPCPPNAPPPPTPRAGNLCPSTMPGTGMWLNCRCPPGLYRRAVWGSHYYSADSGLCAAALHAGAIGPQGGAILVHVGPGRDYYVGKTRNGITSRAMGGASRTITFEGFSDPVEEQRSRYELCQFKFSVYPAARRRASIPCRCVAGSFGFEGAVFGSGPYTPDSNICSAARHAGALTSDDDIVRVVAQPGLQRYEASTRNGVTSKSWGSQPESMRVRREPD